MASRLVFRNLAELERTHLRQAVEIFVSSFYEPFSFISPDVDVIADVLEHSFIPEHYYVALLDGNVVGVAAVSSSEGRAHRFQRDVLVSHLGLFRGTLAYFKLRGVLERPLELEEHQCYIESVVTDSAFRGMGISSQMQKHLLSTLPYSEFLLEVAETNFNAVRMYEKLGFTVYERTPQKSFWKPNSQGGRVSMRRQVTREKMMQ